MICCTLLVYVLTALLTLVSATASSVEHGNVPQQRLLLTAADALNSSYVINGNSQQKLHVAVQPQPLIITDIPDTHPIFKARGSTSNDDFVYYNAAGLYITTLPYAYVLLHYEGTDRDDEYLLGLRVLVRSLQQQNTKYDIVVLLSAKNVRNSTTKQLLLDGCVITLIDNVPNPFRPDKDTDHSHSTKYTARFEHTLNKLYLWHMTTYTRVNYMDSDNLAIAPVDTLFQCGHMCVVFMNPLLFHTGLMIVRPDESMFQQLLTNLNGPQGFSHDGADQGFLDTQFEAEDAPLFVPPAPNSSDANNAPLEEPVMRLALGVNMNHVYYYPTMSWSFFRRAAAFYADPQYPVPAMTIAYPVASNFKPWYWYPRAFFSVHAHWQNVRATLPDEGEWMYIPISRGAATVLFVFAVHYVLIPLLHRTDEASSTGSKPAGSSALTSVRASMRTFISKSPMLLGYAFGAVCWLLYFAMTLISIPGMTPPVYAFPTFFIIHLHLMYATLRVYTLLVTPRSKRSALDSAVKQYLTLLFAQSLSMVVELPLYHHFVVKIAALVGALALWAVIQGHMFRRVNQNFVRSTTTT